MELQEGRYGGRRRHRRERKMIFGIAIAAFGALMLLHSLNILPQLSYYFHDIWPVLLIIIGVAIGLKARFRNNAWWILILIGGIHLLQPYLFPGIPTHRLIWPILLIGIGLAIVFGKHRRHRWNDTRHTEIVTNDVDRINIDVTFGGRKEIITSRSFRGGRVRASFAGVEINLAAADGDIQPMELDVQASFAGIEIIVPSHWELQNEINPTMGSVEDQRMIHTQDTAAEKRTLILRGSCTFGSVEIKSY